MPYHWPAGTDFAEWELDVVDRACSVCGRTMYVCDHRYRRLHTPEGPVELRCRLDHCPERGCPGHARTKRPELEVSIAPPRWAIGWDVFCRIGQRRFSRHRSITRIRTDLRDDHGITLSDDALATYARRYQVMLAARRQDPESLRRHDATADRLVLSIDGLQPEKGHEALYVVRERTGERVWFAEALPSATADEVRRLIAEAKDWAQDLGKPVALWVTDRRDAFATSIAAEFPDVPHRYCDNHFLRDVAEPVLEADSHAKVQMRRKVRGLRTVERAVLKKRRPSPPESPALVDPPVEERASDGPTPPVDDAAGRVVLDYCAAVRGILDDDRGGPLHPPGLRMAEASTGVRDSIRRNPDEKKGGSPSRNSTG